LNSEYQETLKKMCREVKRDKEGGRDKKRAKTNWKNLSGYFPPQTTSAWAKSLVFKGITPGIDI
jgi:hypothetical protein